MIRHIIFDLDSTLYSAAYGLEEKVTRRVKEFVSLYLGISVEEAAAERKNVIKRYGTTLEWLMAEKGFTAADDYFKYLHPEDEADTLPSNPELRRFLESLPCPCSILTNSPFFHAERIINKLGLEGLFHRVFDIRENNFKGKPDAAAYLRSLDALGLKPIDALFIDDIPRYTEGYIALGGRGILFDEKDAHAGYPHERINKLEELTRFFN